MVAAGTTLQGGKYSLDREIGRGGFGITFQATHHYLNHIVVIKTLNEKLRQHPDFPKFERQFQDEARRLATCIHPHIVRISDFFVEAGLPYMVMEYIPGETLGEAYVMAGIPLPEAVATHYIRQIGAALEVVHQNGLLHRDIKPDNIILRRGTQEVVLIDFGIAREFNSGARQTHTGLVSEGYSPIEQYLSSAPRTPATDVYGLAATLYTLLTAQVPMPALLRDREKMPSPKELQPQLSAAVNQAVMRGMAIEAKHRPPTVQEWLKMLPPPAPIPEPARIPTYAVPTIDLSVQQPPPVPVVNPQPQLPVHPTTQPPAAKVTNSPGMDKGVGRWKGSWQKISDRLLRPQTFIATGVAMLAASAGFSVVRMMSPTSTPVNTQNTQPVFEQPTDTSSETVEAVETPDSQPTDGSSEEKTTTPVTNRTRRSRISSESAPTNSRIRRQRFQNTSSTTNNNSRSRRQVDNSSEDNNGTRQESTANQNTPSKGASQLSGTNSRSVSSPPQPQQSPSPSLVERIRKIRDTRNSQSPASAPKNSPPTSGADKPVTPVPDAPKNKDVVVPTQEVQSNNNASEQVIPTE